MNIWVIALMFVISAFVLGLAGIYAVKCLIRIAQALRLSTFIVAFLLGAVATSLPELFVSIHASLLGSSAMVFGNLIGSSILDLTIVAGITIIFARGIKVKQKTIRQDALWMFGFVLLSILLFAIDKTMDRIDAVILLCLLIIYTRYLAKHRKEFKYVLKDKVKARQLAIYSSGLVFFAFMLYYAARFTVYYAGKLALRLGFSEILIALFFVSFGTSLPELVFELRSIAIKTKDIALGDMMGSVIANMVLVMAISALIRPIPVINSVSFIALFFCVLTTYMFVTFLFSAQKLDVMEGIALIMLYLLFIMLEFYLGGMMA